MFRSLRIDCGVADEVVVWCGRKQRWRLYLKNAGNLRFVDVFLLRCKVCLVVFFCRFSAPLRVFVDCAFVEFFTNLLFF